MSQCACRAFGALCAEHGPEGVVFFKAANPSNPPWSALDPQVLAPRGCPRRTVQCFAQLFPQDEMPKDKGGKRCQSSGEKLHGRSKAVKEFIKKGTSALDLHGKLSSHASNSHIINGVLACHTAEGPCPACQAFCPAEYAALQKKRGRPPGSGNALLLRRVGSSTIY
jgi:hypothetical protein